MAKHQTFRPGPTFQHAPKLRAQPTATALAASIASGRLGQTKEEWAESISKDKMSMEELIKSQNLVWEGLNAIRDELNKSTMVLIHDSFMITSIPELIENLGEMRPEYDRFRAVLNNDITKFSERVAEIIKSHAGKTGPITTDEEYQQYEMISMQYHQEYSSLGIVIGPVVMQLVAMVATVNERLQNKMVYVTKDQEANKAALDLANVNIVSDVPVKETAGAANE